ncbi:MAG: FtsW/RodA/SpoVE family cell cycle protein, partial [Woeseiaceae bacterium]|nr:FtsW/RodA/SpoVE family cell cycle protein [Woeseiaceae bacterium]
MSASSVTMPFPARLRSPLQFDHVLLTIALVLLIGGLVILASASISLSEGVGGEPFYYVERQLFAALVGAVAAFFCLLVPMHVWQSLGPLMLLLGLALLAVVLVPGVGYTVNGSTRWLRVGMMNLQVSEPARLCLLLYVAGYLVRQNKCLRERFSGFLRPMLVLTIACGLLLAEPDFGAAIVLLATVLAMLFVAGARWRDFFLFFGVALAAMAAL